MSEGVMFPKGIEQARRDFIEADPILYAYIFSRVTSRTYKSAGDLAGGAESGHGAANRCYAAGAREKHREERFRFDHPTPKKVSRDV